MRFGLGGSTPGPGELALTGVGKTEDDEAEVWYGSMLREGVYMSLESPDRELILAAATAMARLG
jgi:hypothetical protein